MKSDPPTPDPSKLLEAFLASDRSERAFTALVGSLNRLVHSAALRRTGHAQLAEEVSQNVFTILARKAPSLRNHPCLEAWAMETTRLEARTVLRSEWRRQSKTAAFTRGTEARSSTPTEPMDTHENWQDALPLLDDALERLPMKDRRLIIERFYREKKFGEIAAATGQTEGACKKRLKRALEKLGVILKARGVTLSATTLASVLTAEMARSAPVHLAATVALKALAASGSVSYLSVLTNTLQTMSTVKTSTLTAGAVALVAVIPISQQWAEGRKLEEQLGQVESRMEDGARTSNGSQRTTRGNPLRLTPGSMLASLSEPQEYRDMIRALVTGGGGGRNRLELEMVQYRLGLMTDAEKAALFEEMWKYPCGMDERRGAAAAILASMDGKSPAELMDLILGSGRYPAISLMFESEKENPMAKWVKQDTRAAVDWYLEKLEEGAFYKGLGNETQYNLLSDMMKGLMGPNLELAVELYARTPPKVRNPSNTGWNIPLMGLYTGIYDYVKKTGSTPDVVRMMGMLNGNEREPLFSRATSAVAAHSGLDEALRFADQIRSGNGEQMTPEMRESVIEELARDALEVPTDRRLDWAAANGSEQTAMRTTQKIFGVLNDQTIVNQERAMSWLRSEPPGRMRDVAYATLAWKKIQNGNYDGAEGDMSIIGDPSIRSQMETHIAEGRKINEETKGKQRASNNRRSPELKY